MNYAFTKKLSVPFAEAISRTKDALAKEGFGVLSEIDVQETMKKKLGVAHAPYVILGACNPSLAHEALIAEKGVGLFLPCNVIVYEDEGGVTVSIIRPVVAMGGIPNAALEKVAKVAEEKLYAVRGAL